MAPITLPILDIGVIVSFRPVLSGWQRTNVLYGFSYVFPFLAFAILVTLLATRRINVYGVAAFVMVAAAIGYFNFWFVFAIWDSV